MKGRIAVVTGGMGGIGTAICRALHDNGAMVVAGYYRDGDHNSAQEWTTHQQQCHYEFTSKYVDVSNFDSSANFIKQIEAQFGRIDILINNAGITRDSQLYKMSQENWTKVINTNLNGMFNITQNAIHGMIKNNYGRIINISSINGQKGQFGQTNYAAAKAGVHGFTKSLAQEVANKKITVNTLSPGYIATEMVMAVAEEIRAKIINEIPVKRLGAPEDIARSVIFLAGEASGYITGSNLMINGGHYML